MAASFGKRGDSRDRRAGEAKERQSIVLQELLDLRDRQLMLLHMEQQVAAFAGREEVGECASRSSAGSCRLEAQEVLPAATDVGCGLAIAALGNEGTGGADVGARERAVEPDMHEAAGPQQR